MVGPAVERPPWKGSNEHQDKKATTLDRKRKHKVVSRKAWLTARVKLLKAEKALTRRSDELARQRQALPWVRIDKEYRFETDQGSSSLAGLFRGRSQILIYHFMFGPDYRPGAQLAHPSRTALTGSPVHLANHDVMLWAVSRAPFAKLQAYQRRMGWTFPWASSFNSDFNSDFNVLAPPRNSNAKEASNITIGEPAAKADRALEGRETGKWREDPDNGSGCRYGDPLPERTLPPTCGKGRA